jgi:hypothetical protein
VIYEEFRGFNMSGWRAWEGGGGVFANSTLGLGDIPTSPTRRGGIPETTELPGGKANFLSGTRFPGRPLSTSSTPRYPLARRG